MNESFKQNVAEMKAEELVGNYAFLLMFLCGIFVLLHNDSLNMNQHDKTQLHPVSTVSGAFFKMQMDSNIYFSYLYK